VPTWSCQRPGTSATAHGSQSPALHTTNLGAAMTGPEHYKAAEDLLEEAVPTSPPAGLQRLPGGDVAIPVHSFPTAEERQAMIALAHVHATLALAAATAVGGSSFEERAWTNVAGTNR